MKTPIDCIDYVIVHELCPLVYPHHDKAFYRLMKKIMPDWQERKRIGIARWKK
ncbi:MAG: M48 family metallopeptidase [Anaerolineaceae bacterium]|nr:M48 family metallopeptidase [Anaerolineaceae bacterium]